MLTLNRGSRFRMGSSAPISPAASIGNLGSFPPCAAYRAMSASGLTGFTETEKREGGMAMKKITVRKASAIKLTTAVIVGPSYAAC